MLVTLALTACSSGAVGEPTPTEIVSAPSPTPTPTPTREPQVPFDGDCTSVLSAAQLDSLFPGGWRTEAESRDAQGLPSYPDIRATSVGTLGGIECEWHNAAASSDGSEAYSLAIVVLPQDQVPTAFVEDFAIARCDPSYDAQGCRVARSAGEYWVMSRTYGSQEASSSLLEAAADAAVSTIGDSFDGVPADDRDGWFTPLECEDLAEEISIGDVIGAGYVNGYWEGSTQPEEILLSEGGVGFTCPWYSVDGSAPGGRSYIIQATVASGGAWDWDRIATRETATPVPVEGAVAAVTYPVNGDSVWLYATDGINVVELTNGDVGGLGELAGRMLALNG
ncbi:hypothetical protein ACFQ0P_00615 [Microbacterium insulae]|uniref:DUF3558 domain-containing protein n=1 Tax=Microbacterium insulae TaxID=483014 RepID=A0ABW3AD81_9MICO